MIVEHIFSNFNAIEQLTIDNDSLLEYAKKETQQGSSLQSRFLDLSIEPIKS